MKWTFVIQQKLKVALLLGLVMCLVVLFNLILQKNISDINRSVNSIYNDRLIPATDIFHLSENLHSRQLAMENFLYKKDISASELKKTVSDNNKAIHELITKYEKTYLVKEESVFLNRIKHSMANYVLLENRIYALKDAGQEAKARDLYATEGRNSLKNTIHQLADLTTIQSAVGSKLVNDTKGIVALSGFLSTLQLVLAIVIGGMITALVVSSKIINQSPSTNFKWN